MSRFLFLYPKKKTINTTHSHILKSTTMKWNDLQIRYDDEDEDEGPQPDSTLEQGVPIPVRMQGSFPPELASTPLEDIDTFYANQRVSIAGQKREQSNQELFNGKECERNFELTLLTIFRFHLEWLVDPPIEFISGRECSLD